MQLRTCSRDIAVTLAALLVGVTASADGPAKNRPLSDFLSTQGLKTVYIPPAPDYLGWIAPAPGVKTPTSSYLGGNSASCDYAGVANAWIRSRGGPDLHTAVSGTVTVNSLDDGRIYVKVNLHTTSALVFGLRITLSDFGDFANDPVIFGARAQDVILGATPGIGECHALFAWKQSPGPLADVSHVELTPKFEWVTQSFRANAKGPLTALAGYGPTGTPGRLMISQTGIYHASFKGATADAFPAEFVEVRAVGN